MKRLANKVAIVTGASKGIGAAIAQKLAAEGASVVVNYANAKTDAENVVSLITDNGGQAIALQGDVSKSADIDQLFAQTVQHYGGVDILVNNAGIYQWGALEEVTEEGFQRQFNINVLGVLLASKAAARNFPETGGSIINIGSAISSNQPPGSAIYTATKSAVDSITRVLSKELGARKIRVNSINPGMVDTEGARTAGFIGSEMETFMVNNTPLQRVGVPEDVALVAAFLSSEESRWLTGEVILASGGVR
ncbi:SDR family NAD(P)-dependent oxidoreductase [Chitinophaga pinensis]|uniref:Short-chain dehydrogenase/reductase SDR n=1 Tax=Chitinophaga pinensis (strain ATCC 43595 / DSM 2588 / LMG 13176 / NBRC 15968 / NCIMB 11800 / UQM 2034) TaxID=485918 RepID=A0A979G6Q4_CHIPD|nr:glucose 1-dehydrogenase [Chitinophaga pinensis]ACU61750.1 short-chain dehydrogenase/reductase SDR [Chitinophaga pinensis DSM 2588]